MVSRQYLDSSLTAKASDAVVIHNSGDESVTGVKTFAASPLVPTPTISAAAVNKAYVDTALSTVGAGSYVSKTGDTMTGPLLLNSERSDIRRSVYDRIVNAVIAVAVSAAIALHDHFGIR